MTLGQGTAISGDPGLSLTTVFANQNTITGSASCSYTPAAGDGRYLQVTIDDAGTLTTLSPDIAVVSTPYALVADSVQGKSPTDFIQVNGSTAALTQANLESVFSTSPNVSQLQSLIAGTSTKYLKANPSDGTVVPGLSVNPSTPVAGQFWYDSVSNTLKYYNGSNVMSLSTGGGGGSVTSVTAGTGLTGGTITTAGTISLDISGVTPGTYSKVTVDSYGRVTNAAALAVGDIPGLDASHITTGTISPARLPNNLYNWSSSGMNDIAYTSGFVGVQQPAPIYPLDVNGDINVTGKIRSSGVAAISFLGSPPNNTVVGVNAMNALTIGTANNNTAVGFSAGSALTTATSNTLIGSNVATSLTTGSNNTVIGSSTAPSLTSGSQNIIIGSNIGTSPSIGTGMNNILIGNNVQVMTANTSYRLNIANLIRGNLSTNKLGIGIEPSGAYLLEVNGPFSAQNVAISMSGTETANAIGPMTNVGTGIHFPSDTNVAIATSNLTRMYVSSSGNVGIGTTTPGYNLHVVGTAGLSTGSAWTMASDERLKDITGDYEYGLNEILRLHTVRFNYKKDNALRLPSNTPVTGFIAQEVQKVIPDAVRTRADGYLELNADPIHWAAVNAIQDLHGICEDHHQQASRRIANLEEANASLQAKNAELEARLQKQEQDLQLIKTQLGVR